MKKKVVVLSILIALVLAWFYQRGWDGKSFSVGKIIPEKGAVDYRLEEVVSGLYVPWSIVFTNRNRMVFTERNGRIRVYENGRLKDNPLYVFKEVVTGGEEGLMGLVAHPNYVLNHYLYVSVAYGSYQKMQVKVVRLVDQGESAKLDRVILDGIPAAEFHAGNRLKFGPDGKLYITTGDATQRDLAQNKSSLAGKILRLNDDGTIPSDNPFPGSAIYSFGHRNPQGIAWDMNNKLLFETEHGPSGFDGPGGGDELNLIEAGVNYGWPVVSHTKSAAGMKDPLLVWTPAVAPASLLFYSGKLFPQFADNLFFGGLRGEGLFRVILDANKKPIHWEKLAGVSVGRVREVVEGPEGEIYFSTSNQDGRGRVRDGDDHIYRLVAK